MKKALLMLLAVPFLGGCWGKKETVAPTPAVAPVEETHSSTVPTESEEVSDTMTEDEK